MINHAEEKVCPHHAQYALQRDYQSLLEKVNDLTIEQARMDEKILAMSSVIEKLNDLTASQATTDEKVSGILIMMEKFGESMQKLIIKDAIRLTMNRAILVASGLFANEIIHIILDHFNL